MKFKPMLASNEEIDLGTIKYPKFASYKLDGIRCVFHPELGMVSRSLKPIQNKQLREKFQYMKQRSVSTDTVFDGEFYAHNRTFQEITRAVMTKDFYEEKTLKKFIKEFGSEEAARKYIVYLINDINFHCFEYITDTIQVFNEKYHWFNGLLDQTYIHQSFIPVKQILVGSEEEINKLFEQALEDGYEGLILRDPNSTYKFGRSTAKEEYMLKVKPFKTFDAVITGVVQSTEVDPNAEKTINELGRSVTSKKKGDRVLIEKASAFNVEYEGIPLKVSIAMTDTEKEWVWKNKEDYIGKMIEYKGLLIGAKDVPRHSIFIRFREDRND